MLRIKLSEYGIAVPDAGVSSFIESTLVDYESLSDSVVFTVEVGTEYMQQSFLSAVYDGKISPKEVEFYIGSRKIHLDDDCLWFDTYEDDHSFVESSMGNLTDKILKDGISWYKKKKGVVHEKSY